MKNFTATLLSFREGVVSNSRQSVAVENSEVENIHNNRTNFSKNISTRNFLWGFYGIFSSLFKSLGGRVMSVRKGFNNSEKYHDYLKLVMGSRVYLNIGRVSIASRSLIGIFIALLTLNSNIANAQCTGTSVAGTVFRDFNLNGVKDNTHEIGLAGVTIKAFNSSNAQVGTTTSAANGTYSITGLSGSVRVEFSTLPAGYVSGPDGSSSGTSVQFVALSSTVGCNVNFGVNHPDDFCAKSGVQPKVAVPCYINGSYTGSDAPNEDALVSFAYNKTGNKADAGNEPNILSKYNTIGSVWGMAYNKYTKTLFATAFMKRHSGFGPKGISGLYVVQNADASGLGTVTGINLQTLLGINAGTEPTRKFASSKTQPADDGGNTVFNAVGKMSFGDCELSTDGNTLYITNLFDKKIYVLNVSNPLTPTLITSYSVPNPACAVGSEYAPFGLKFYRDKLYVGVVCTAESSQPPVAGATYGQAPFDRTTLSSSNLKATVYELNGTTFSMALTQFPLNYDRGRSNSDSASYAIWRPWVNNFSQVNNNRGETYPQPMLSDIEFDSDGSMILGFADRYSHQLGNANYPPGQTYTVTGRVEGDVMRATKSGSIWLIENNGTASGITTSGTNKKGGPGGGEYYFGDLTVDHDEPAMGGLALYPGTGEVMTTIAGPVDIFYSGGTRRMNNNTGDFLYTGAPTAPNSATWNSVSGYRFALASRPDPIGDYKLYEGNSPSTFGKASGLGDIEVFCSIAPLEIGNRIWRDYNRNGIQDAGEPGIGNITVLLFKDGMQVATTATDANGEYYFNDLNVTNGLLPNMAYEIRVLQNQVGNTFLSPTNANSNNSDNIDSDASSVSGNAVIALNTGVNGESNHTYDIGFSPNCPTFANPQPNGGTVAICSGTATDLTLTVSNVGSQPLAPTTPTTTIQWVYFTSATANPYSGGTALSPTATLADGTVTSNLNFPANTGTTPTPYYVYVILNPTPDGSNPNCHPSVAYIVTVNPIPAPPTNISGGGAFCKTAANPSFPLTATCAINTTPVWYISQSTTTNFFIGDTYNATVSGTFYVSCKGTSAPNCETVSPNRKPVSITINDTPVNPTDGQASNGAICLGESVSLTATCGTNEIAQWYDSSNNSITNLTLTPTVANTYNYTVGCKNTLINCETPQNLRKPVVLVVNPVPSAPLTSNVQGGAVCVNPGSSGTVNLTALCGTNETPQWYAGNASNSAFIVAGTSYSPSISQTTTYYVSCKHNSTNCESPATSRTLVIGTVNTNPASPTSGNVTPASRCDAGSVTLTATCLTGQVPQWHNANALASTFLIAGTSYSVSINATTTYFVGCKTTATSCETPAGSRTPVTATVNPNLPAPASGQTTPGSVCFTGTVTLGATCPTGQTVQWYNNNTQLGTPLGTENSFITPNISVTTPYYVSCRDNITGCETLPANRQSVLATVIINVSNGGQIAASQSSCGPFVPAKLTNVQPASGGNSTVEYLWLKNSTASQGTFDPNDPAWVSTLIETPEYQPSTISITTTFIRCARSAGCKEYTVESNPVTITINPFSDAPTDQKVLKGDICIGETISLSATCGANQIVKWYEGSTLLGTYVTGGLIYQPTSIGTKTYSVSCQDINQTTKCETIATNRKSVIVNVFAIPVTPSAVSIDKTEICIGSTVTLKATCETNETAHWYEGSTTTLIGTGASLTYQPTSIGDKTYTVGCKNNATNCETSVLDRGKVFLKVNDIPAIPTSVSISNAAICLGESVSLKATCGTNETAQWYEGTSPIGTGGSFTYKPLSTGTKTYTVGCRNNTSLCETKDTQRKPVTLTINEVPAAPTSATGGAVCGSGTVKLTATCATGTTPVWYEASTGFVGGVTGTPFEVTVTANKSYYVACRSTTSPTFCESTEASRKKVDVIFNTNPTPTISATPNAICVGGKTTLKVNETWTTYTWSGPNAFDETTQSVVIDNIVSTQGGIYKVVVSAAGGCTASATVNITVYSNPSVTTSVLDATVCNQSTIHLRSSAMAGTGTISSYSWTGVNSYTAGIQNPDILNATALMTGNYIVKVTDSNNCTATSQVAVTINPLPTVTAISKGGNTICLGSAIYFEASGAGVGGTYLWTGPTAFTSSTAQNPTIAGTTAGNAGTYNLTITDANGCTATTSIVIKIDKCLRIGNLVWEDTNNNGIKDATESGVTTPVKVELFLANSDGTLGAFVATQNTVNGLYSFSGLEPGEYIVQITAPTGYKSSTGTNGLTTGPFEPAKDVDLVIADNQDRGKTVGTSQVIQSLPITLTNFQEPDAPVDTDDNNGNLTVDFGIYQPGKIGDFVFVDINRNGQQDAGDAGVQGITVNLYDSSSSTVPVATATTDANGKYLFDNLKPETYVVEFIKSTLPDNKQFTTQNQGVDATDSDANIGTGKSDPIILGIGENNLTVDAGIQCPLPTVDAFTSTPKVCVGGTILLTSKVSTTPSVKAYSWAGPGYTGGTTADVSIANAVTTNTGIYTVTVTANSICLATASSTVAVIVNPNPTASAKGITVCQGEPITLTGTGDGTYAWSRTTPAGTFTSSVASPMVTDSAKLSDAGIYQLIIKTGENCTVIATATVIVNTRPATPTETTKSGNICDGETLSLAGKCGVGETIKWYKGTVELLVTQNFNPGAVGTYVYSGVCKNTSTLCETLGDKKVIVTITVDKLPAVPDQAKVSKGIICLNETVNLSGSCGTGELPKWYSGTPNGTLVTNLTFTPAAAGTYKYYASCKSTTGAFCETPEANRKEVILIINNNPTASASVENNTVCIGSTIKFKGEGTTGSTFVWTGPGFIRTEQNPSIANAIGDNRGVYTLTVTNGSKCTATATVSVTILVNPSVTATGATVCVNDPIYLTSTPDFTGTTTGNTVNAYAWTGPDNFTDSVQNPSIAKAETKNGGVYTVTITDYNGCTAVAYATVKVNILPNPTASSNTPICTGNELKLSVTEYVGGSYSWAAKGSFTGSTVREPSIPVTTTANGGIYTVTVKDANGCTATTTTEVKVENCLKLGDFVWNDVNNNGKVDAGEAGIDGVKVDLFKAKADGTIDGAAIATQSTVAGKYLFANLEPGDYIVQITAQTGYKSSTGTNGSATGPNEPASDVDVTVVNNQDRGTTITGQTIQSKAITLTNFGEPAVGVDGDDSNGNLTVDFGLFKSGSIGDFVWYDLNRDGIQDASELGVDKVTIKLFDKDNNLVGTTITGTDGKYIFKDLAPNDYRVEFSTLPTGYVFSPKGATTNDKDSDVDAIGKTETITLTAGQNITTVDAGINCPAPKAIAKDMSVCLNNKLQIFSENISSPFVEATYSWTKNGTFVSTEQNPIIAVNATNANAGTYVVTMTSKNGCSATSTAQVVVTINPLPTATASYNNPVCLNSKLELNVETNGTLFSWTGPDTFTSSVQKPVIASAKAVNGGVYTVVVSNGNSCAVAATVSVSVNALPTPTAKSIEVCVGKEIRLDATTGFKSHAWLKIAGVGTFTALTQNPTVSLSAITDNAGTYQVLVTNDNGCTAIATATVIVNELPKPTAYNNGPVCVGTPIILTTNAGFTKYAWAASNGFTASTTVATIPNAVTSNAGIYTVTVTNAKGCIATATTNVEINTKPNPVITKLDSKCSGEIITLTVTGNTNDKYSWKGIGNTFTSTVQNPTVSPTPNAAGIYTYFVTVEGIGGCTGTATTTVTIKALPTVIVPSTSICAGTIGKLTASGATTYAWSSNTGETFTSTIADLSVTKQGIYTVIGTTDGCTAVATTIVEVKVLPTVTLTPITICTGTTGTLTATGTNVATYAWSSNTGETFTSTTATISVTKTGTYTVIGTSSGQCTAIAMTTVTVNTKPNPEITPIPSVCSGGNVVLNVSGTTGNTYAWSGSGFTSSVQNPTVVPKPTTAGIYTYSVLVEGTGGCTGTATTAVTVKAIPTVTVPTIAICVGTTDTLRASGADSYSWSKGATNYTTTTAKLAINETGTYTVIGTINGCSATVTVEVTSKLAAKIEAGSVEICIGQAKELKATGGVTYTWSGADSFTATGAIVTVPKDGTYTVIGKNADGCIGTAIATLTTKDNPTVVITGDTVICTGTKAKLTASGTGTFAWTQTPTGFTSTSATVEVGQGTYQVIVTNGSCSAVGTIKVVNDNLSISAGGVTVCEGVLTTALTGGATATSGIKSYAWSSPSGFTSTEQSPTITKPTATATYTLTVTSKAGCTATATAIITVTPAVTNTASVTFCKGGKATLIATGGTGATYLWTSGGATTSSIEVTIAGTYNVTITDLTGCISKGIFTVTESAVASAIISGNTSLCTSTSTTLTVNAGVTSETYSWTGVGGFTSNSQVITVSTPGDYAVLVKTQEGCEGTAKVTVTAGFTPTAVCGPVCVGDSIRFSTTQLRGLTYSWSKNGRFISSSADPKLLNVQKSDEGVYEVVITGGGCTATVVATLVVYDKPTGITATAQNSTCDQDTPKNDGSIKLAGTFAGLKYDIVEGATYTGTKKYADATDIPANGIVKSSIANPATNAGNKYTVRVFNANNCYEDYPVIIQQVICSCGEAKCVPYGVVKTKSGKK